MKSRTLAKLSKHEPVKLETLKKFTSIPAQDLKKSGLDVKKFKAGVVVDKNGSPKYFIFDTYSLWDLLCVFDAKFEKIASTEEYVLRNPVGWFIDAIEAHLPINPKLALKLKKGIEETEKLGMVSFDKIKHKLGLS